MTQVSINAASIITKCSAHAGISHTFSFHASLQTSLVTARLTAIALPFVDNTVVVLATRVLEILSDRSLEETLTALTAVNNHSFVNDCII